MKNLRLVALLLSCSVVPTAFAEAKRFHAPYLGVEVIQTNQRFKSQAGADFFAKKPQNYAVFAGLKFNHNFGLEAGYEVQYRKKLTSSARVAGYDATDITTSGSISFNSKVSGLHPYLGFTGEVGHKSLKLQAMLAASFSRVKTRLVSVTASGTVPAELAAGRLITGTKNRIVPMAKVSVIYNFTEKFAARLSLNYRNLKAVKISIDQNPNIKAKMRDTFGGGIGLMYCF